MTQGTPVTPRFAATVVVARPRAGSALDEIFMVRRSSKSPFMPDALVFPGGALDAADGEPGSDEAFLRAAQRECVEEAHIDLADAQLAWFDTWLTPSVEPRRFLARFYLCRVEENSAASARADEFETHDGRWATPAEILALANENRRMLAPPTYCALLRLSRGEGPRLLKGAHDGLREPILPKWIKRDERDIILLPHDPDYASAEGETGPTPMRVHDLPPRFVMESGRWKV
jgi:8-oxo-dGTP pyrophosphatase MutT (NUDIX family)